MKRVCYLTLILMILVIFSGCGSKEAPGTLVEYDVEGHLNYYEVLAKGYYDINCSFDHNWDGEANTDTIDVTVKVVYPYGTDTLEGQMVYLYDRASDNWNLIRTEGLIDAVTMFDGAALEGEWIVYSNDPDDCEDYLEYYIGIENVDTNNMTVDMYYTVKFYEAVYVPGTWNIPTFEEFNYDGYDEGEGTYDIVHERWIEFESLYGDHEIRLDKIDGVVFAG